MFTDEQSLTSLKQLATELGRTPNRDEWTAAKLKPGVDSIRKRWSTWGEFVIAAGLPYHSHYLKSQDGQSGVCIICGPVKLLWKVKYRKRVLICENSGDGKRKTEDIKKMRDIPHPYRQFKKDHCENPDCTATILHVAMLDVHHVDHNHDNNDESNLVTLCANCHRGVHHGVVVLSHKMQELVAA